MYKNNKQITLYPNTDICNNEDFTYHEEEKIYIMKKDNLSIFLPTLCEFIIIIAKSNSYIKCGNNIRIICGHNCEIDCKNACAIDCGSDCRINALTVEIRCLNYCKINADIYSEISCQSNCIINAEEFSIIKMWHNNILHCTNGCVVFGSTHNSVYAKNNCSITLSDNNNVEVDSDNIIKVDKQSRTIALGSNNTIVDAIK